MHQVPSRNVAGLPAAHQGGKWPWSYRGLVPAHVDREPRAVVSHPPGRHAAPRHRL